MKRILPQPTKEKPYAQIDFIFLLIANTKVNKNTRSNYLTALSFYKRFLKDTNNYNSDLAKTGLFYLKLHWNEFSLLNIKKYIEGKNVKGQEGYLSSHSLVGIISAIRTVIKESITLGYTSFNSVFDISLGTASKETEVNTSYSNFELKQIERLLKDELKYVYRVLSKEGYKPTGLGKDPRIRKNGWGEIDNMRWYFENVLHFKPILGTFENKSDHKGYVEVAPRSHYSHIGGLRGIYRKWGVAPLIDVELIMPLVLQLTMHTGLNIQSIFELELDCFEEQNPISGVPVLRYSKGRSGGEKEMHIDLTVENDNNNLREFRQDQAKIIKNTIKLTKELTEQIRAKAPIALQNKLFILQSSSPNKFAQIISFSSKISQNWCKKMREKYNLKCDSNEDLNFNLRRFRATRATKLVYDGADLHELQYELGHKSIVTTMGYLDKNKLNATSNTETNSVIEKIFSNKAWAETSNVEYVQKTDKLQENTVFKGFLCDCKNPFNPPEDVKKLKSYIPGTACSRVNMCLFCDNVLVFKRNLPSLWMYKRQIETSMESNSSELPNQEYYLKTLDVINALFDVKKSEFSERVILEAQILSENLDELIDPVTYKAETEA